MENYKLTLTELGRLMREVFRVFKNRIAELDNSEIKITSEQFGLLHAISTKEDDVIQKDMAEIMGKDKSAILRLIDSLEEKGLVRRVTDKHDRRKNYLMITKLGEKTITQYMQISEEVMKELQQGLTPGEITSFIGTARHIRNQAQQL